jgi:hypothetical protein
MAEKNCYKDVSRAPRRRRWLVILVFAAELLWLMLWLMPTAAG